ncbi:Veg family protein [Saccharibacillus sacchari]|uniref:Veg family protein n=1 Tax=Saccharibacillus sacchari TaxID=456493 RepID=A0ACC6P7U6_9BACL
MANQTLSDIKRSLEAHVGHRVMLRANGGRRKTVEQTGVLEGTYPAVFTVMLEEEAEHASGRVSYSYADVLTETVELSLMEDDSEIPIAYAGA